MKKETLKKANLLAERLEFLPEKIHYGTSGNCGSNLDNPDLVLNRDFDLNLIKEDADKLRDIIQKFVNSLRVKLQSEFDNLK